MTVLAELMVVRLPVAVYSFFSEFLLVHFFFAAVIVLRVVLFFCCCCFQLRGGCGSFPNDALHLCTAAASTESRPLSYLLARCPLPDFQTTPPSPPPIVKSFYVSSGRHTDHAAPR